MLSFHDPLLRSSFRITQPMCPIVSASGPHPYRFVGPSLFIQPSLGECIFGICFLCIFAYELKFSLVCPPLSLPPDSQPVHRRGGVGLWWTARAGVEAFRSKIRGRPAVPPTHNASPCESYLCGESNASPCESVTVPHLTECEFNASLCELNSISDCLIPP